MKYTIEKDFSPWELEIFRLLSQGKTQTQIAADFKRNNIEPYSIRTIELKTRYFKDLFNCSTMFQFGAVLHSKELVKAYQKKTPE